MTHRPIKTKSQGMTRSFRNKAFTCMGYSLIFLVLFAGNVTLHPVEQKVNYVGTTICLPFREENTGQHLVRIQCYPRLEYKIIIPDLNGTKVVKTGQAGALGDFYFMEIGTDRVIIDKKESVSGPTVMILSIYNPKYNTLYLLGLGIGLLGLVWYAGRIGIVLWKDFRLRYATPEKVEQGK